MPVNTNLPWLPNNEQFLRAIIAGSQIGQARERDNRPRFGGGGGGGAFRPPEAQPEAKNPNDPHYVLNGSILSYVDPRNAQEATPTLSPKPFDVLGQQFISDPISGKASPFVPPSTVEKVGNDLVKVTKAPGQSGFMGETTPDKITVDKLYEGGNPPGVNISQVDTTGMSDKQKRMVLFENPPRITGSPVGISNYLSSARGMELPPSQESTPRVTSQAQYDALPPGTIYINESGARHRKP